MGKCKSYSRVGVCEHLDSENFYCTKFETKDNINYDLVCDYDCKYFKRDLTKWKTI